MSDLLSAPVNPGHGPLTAAQNRLSGIPPLTLKDTCDSSSSGVETAQVVVFKGFFILHLCKNHFERHALSLTADGWAIAHDNRAQLR